jgi:hypothetical protein
VTPVHGLQNLDIRHQLIFVSPIRTPLLNKTLKFIDEMPITISGGGVSSIFASRQRFTIGGLSMDDYSIENEQDLSLVGDIIREIIVFVSFWLFVVLYLLAIT